MTLERAVSNKGRPHFSDAEVFILRAEITTQAGNEKQQEQLEIDCP